MTLHLHNRVILTVILAASFLGACTRTPPDEVQARWKRGAPPFSFDYLAVTDLMFSKNDPQTGDQWDAQLKKTPVEGHDGALLWEVTSSPSGTELLDRRANSAFILHLLDSLRKLTIQDLAPNGPPASFGLDSPRLILRWKTPEREYEVRLGNPTHVGAYAWIPEFKNTFNVQGAALEMMGFVRSFDYLRQKRLSTWTSDDVWEIEFTEAGKAPFYAQRLGDGWGTRRNKPLSLDVQPFLDGLMHLQIQEFVDDRARSEKLRREFGRDPRFTLTLKDRLGKRLQIRFAAQGGELYAIPDDRPGAFRLYPEAVRLFSIPAVRAR